MAKTIALITAGGSGSRMKSEIKKQYIEINNKPILAHSINKFQVTETIDEIYIVSPAEDIAAVKLICSKYNYTKVKSVIEGGITRQKSVFKGLDEITASDEDIILIHDGVRPFVSHEIISECYNKIIESDCCVTGIKPADTVKTIKNGFIYSTLNRDELLSVQTPQTFRYGVIKKCHELAEKKGFTATDDSALLEKYSIEILGRNPIINIVYGNVFNIKITNPDDLVIADALLDYLSV